ncbi:MAG: FAD:protein FMN transferase [Betaproteobacteria bacterium]|nr:FAD:protein FMN transferase [Betaproteobacteria bacterium]
MRKSITTLLLLILVGISVFALNVFNKEPLYHSQSYLFGTLVDISIYGEPEARARQLSNQIFSDFQTLHQQLHAWKPATTHQASELGRLNHAFAQGKQAVDVSPLLAHMLHEATALSIKSNGLFNPAIGHLIGTWGFQRDEIDPMDVDDNQIQSLVQANPQMTDIVVKDQQVYSNNAAVKLDFGGYAKGYALDIAADYLRRQQIKNALINIGGNVIALGQHGKKPWRVGIQHPRQPSAIASLILPDGWAIGTSGDYQRFFTTRDGKRYCHMIDPRTGYPVQHTQAVTVLIPPQAPSRTQAGVLSDVASKPIFIASLEDKTKAAAMFDIQNFMYIDQQSHITVSKNMVKKLQWLDAHVKFTTIP